MRKFRALNELLSDPNFPIRVGRLIGASEMVSHYLLLKENDPEAKEMGKRLQDINDWFFENDN